MISITIIFYGDSTEILTVIKKFQLVRLGNSEEKFGNVKEIKRNQSVKDNDVTTANFRKTHLWCG